MILSHLLVRSAGVLSLFAGIASAHIHVGVDTASGIAGDQIRIRAGYYPAENTFTIDTSGRLRESSVIAVFDVTDQLPQAGLLSNWYAGDEILLTSDFYFATGRLDGGNFRYEIAGITSVSGGPGVIAWGDFDALGGFAPLAFSTGATRLERSFDTAIAGHDHEQGYAFSAPGLYDVTLIAWDSNGRYLDSSPLVVRFNVVPSPAGAAVLALGALMAARRRRI